MTVHVLSCYKTGFDCKLIFGITISGSIFHLKNALSGFHRSLGTCMIRLRSSYHKDDLACVSRTNVFYQVVGKCEVKSQFTYFKIGTRMCKAEIKSLIYHYKSWRDNVVSFVVVVLSLFLLLNAVIIIRPNTKTNKTILGKCERLNPNLHSCARQK